MKTPTYIYEQCLKDIDGEKNPDLAWYTNRPKTITRKSFYNCVVFAVWVSGMRRVSATSFLERACTEGFSWSYADTAKLTSKQWTTFLRKLHGNPIPRRAEQKWSAIRSIAIEMATYEDDRAFRADFFAGKYRSSDLSAADVCSLKNRKLPYIGIPNAQFIVRNMGGEVIKCDRWLQAFLSYCNLPLTQLEKELEKAAVPAGLFDLVIWSYCEKYVKTVKNFHHHFGRKFG